MNVKRGSDDSDLLRSLTIIYGFFFVLMSALLSSASSIASSFYIEDPLFFYFLIVLLAISITIIGKEIVDILIERGLSKTGGVGLVILTVFTPVLFVWVIGKTIVGTIPVIPGIPFEVFSLAELGLLGVVIFGSVITVISIIHTFWKKKQKARTATPDNESTHSEKNKTSSS